MKNHIKIFKNLKNNEDGSVLIMAGAFILVTIAIAGAAVDFGRAQLLQMKEQQSTDIAALAAATILDKKYNSADDKQIREDAANRYYNLNFPTTYLGVTREAPKFNYNADTGTITVDGQTNNIKTNYIATAGTKSIDVSGKTKVNIPDDDQPDFDVAMVIDESGSTRAAAPDGGGKNIITVEKEAITTMLSVLFPENQPLNKNLRFGLVGYSGPIVHAYGLTSDKNQAQSYVNNLDWYYQNYDHWGLEAGFNMVTGDWKGFVQPSSCGVHQSTTCIPQRNTDVPDAVTKRSDSKNVSRSKYIVFITDGYIMEEPAPCATGLAFRAAYPAIDTEEFLAGDKCKNYRIFLEKCDAIKNASNGGVVIYTINFVSRSVGDLAPMKACATDPNKYFYAPDGQTLKSILTGIATQIRKIRITD